MLTHTNNNEVILKLHQIRAIQFGEFTLKSGQKSALYINLRKIISYPSLLAMIADLMWEKVAKAKIDLICGVPYAALPIATCLSLKHNIPMIMRRKEKKEYGTKQQIEGVFSKDQRCLVIEDVITTGGSILETVADLQKEGLIIEDVAAFTARDDKAFTELNKKFTMHTCFTLTEILNILLSSTVLANEEKNIIEKYLQTEAKA